MNFSASNICLKSLAFVFLLLSAGLLASAALPFLLGSAPSLYSAILVTIGLLLSLSAYGLYRRHKVFGYYLALALAFTFAAHSGFGAVSSAASATHFALAASTLWLTVLFVLAVSVRKEFFFGKYDSNIGVVSLESKQQEELRLAA